jgi:serine/threonine-protein kinase RsbW
LATATPFCVSPPVPAATTATLLVRAASDLPRVLDPVEAAMAGLAYPRRDILGVRLALEEAMVNALKHGHRGDPAKAARVRYRVTTDKVMAEVVDEGPGFDPGRVADPLAGENLDRPCGRGLLLMRHYMTWVRFNPRGNAVTLCKCRAAL